MAMHLQKISVTCVIQWEIRFTEKGRISVKSQEPAMFSRNAYSRNEYTNFFL